MTVASVPTDDLGEYRIGSLPAGVYVVSVNAVGMPGALSSVGDFVVFGRARGGGGGVASFSTSGDRGRVYYPAAQTFADAQPITLQAGDERTSVNFTVASAPLPRTAVPPPPIASRDPNRTDSCAILGRIVQLPDGRPLARASVRAIPVQAPNAQHVAVTDDDGRYELRQLRPGGYRIFASTPDVSPVRVAAPRHVDVLIHAHTSTVR